MRGGRAMSDAEFAASAPDPRPKAKSVGPKQRDRFASECASMIQQRSWRGAQAGHLVALYCWCHGEVYRVPPAELDAGNIVGCVHSEPVRHK